ncbi:MAG: hypothetical protein KAI57_02075 [Candidatus Pacebacteria bacterium]|nr:hypothetical protein [Candidatus Paceibacterota bacterium]
MVKSLIETLTSRITAIKENKVPDFKIEIKIKDREARFIIPRKYKCEIGNPEIFRNGIKKDLEQKLPNISLIDINEGIVLVSCHGVLGGYSVGPLIFTNKDIWNDKNIEEVVEIIKENYPLSFEVEINLTAN